METRLVFGTVEGVSSQEITLNNIQRVPSGSPVDKSARMVVIVTEATIIERSVKKDAVTIKKEQVAYDSEVQKQKEQGTTTQPMPVQLSKNERITTQDIKIGDAVSVLATGDVAGGSTITAERIAIQDGPPVQTEPPRLYLYETRHHPPQGRAVSRRLHPSLHEGFRKPIIR